MEEQSTEDTSAMKSARAKMTYLRKKLDSKDHVIREKEETINTLQQHIEAKERVLAERDNFTNYNSELVEENSMGIETFHADSLSDSEQVYIYMYIYCIFIGVFWNIIYHHDNDYSAVNGHGHVDNIIDYKIFNVQMLFINIF